jgi:hypothetical protein
MSDLYNQAPEPQRAVGSTSAQAGAVAALRIGSWRYKILQRLAEAPSTLFELASFFNVSDHQISGRLTELSKDGLIEPSGQRRTKPETGCEAEVWKLTDARPAAPDLESLFGYPMSLQIAPDGLFRRRPIDAAVPGIPYSSEKSGLTWYLSILECPGCGKPLRFFEERIAGLDDVKVKKLFRCCTKDCNRTWELAMVNEPGQPMYLSLVMKVL